LAAKRGDCVYEREREQEGGRERVRTTILIDSVKMRTTVPLHKAESGEKRWQEKKDDVGSDRLAISKERGDHTGRRSVRKAVELGSIPACIPPKQEALFEYMHYLPSLVAK
jgi:hypothetical protein